MLLLYTARWVLPVTSPPIPDGAVGVDDGRIVYAGPRAGAPRATIVDLGEAYLLPGLVNAHTHLELTAMRGFLEDGAFRPWLLRLTSARANALDEPALYASARRGIAEGLLAGITTYADTSSSGAPLEALVSMGVRGISYQEVFGPDPAQCAASMAELRERLSHLAPRTSRLVRLGVSPHAPYTVSDDLYRSLAEYALAESLPVAVHIAESRDEVALVTAASGAFADGWRERGIAVTPRATSPIALLEATGILGLQPLLIHCVQVSADDIRAIAAVRAPVVHSPTSNAKLGHGIAPLGRLLEAGIDVGLGSDSVASNNRMDMLDEARFAALAARASDGRCDMGASRALELATLGGARALGLGGEVGSLDVGKAADLAAFPIDPLRDEPIYDAVTALVFGGGGRRALMVAVAGVELVRDGRLVASLEEDQTPFRTAAAQLGALAVAAQTRG